MAYECKPCIWIDPFLENEIAKIYVPMGIKILKVDVKEFKKLAKKEKVKAMPTFVFYKGGERVESFAGASPQRIVEILDDLLGIEKPKPVEEEPENAVPKGLQDLLHLPVAQGLRHGCRALQRRPGHPPAPRERRPDLRHRQRGALQHRREHPEGGRPDLQLHELPDLPGPDGLHRVPPLQRSAQRRPPQARSQPDPLPAPPLLQHRSGAAALAP